MKIIPIIFAVTVITTSCSKEKCDSSQICVVNTGNDTINYCWGCNAYTEVLLPGQKTCIDTGPIEVEKDAAIASVFYFDSDHGNIAIKLNDCYVERQIQ